MLIKTQLNKNVRDYSAMWLSKASEETNCLACCRYGSNSLGTDEKIQGTNPKPKHFLLKSLTMPIQLQMSSQEEWLLPVKSWMSWDH